MSNTQFKAKKSPNSSLNDLSCIAIGITSATIGRWVLNRYGVSNIMFIFDALMFTLSGLVIVQIYRENILRDTYRPLTMMIVFTTQGWLLGCLIYSVI